MLTVPDARTGILGKQVGDLIGPDVRVLRDGSVIGTLKYVTEFEQFNKSNPAEQKGNYFPMRLTKPGSKMTLKKNGAAAPGKSEMDFDPELVLRVDSPETTFTVEVDGKDVVTLNFRKAKLPQQ